jgi:hypothetical protein
LNLGARFDYINGSIPEQHWGVVRYAGPRDFAAIHDLPNWKDVSPRMGAAYDVSGTGKTVIKVNLGQYLESEGTSIASAVNPGDAPTGTSGTRAWVDSNGDSRQVDCHHSIRTRHGDGLETSQTELGSDGERSTRIVVRVLGGGLLPSSLVQELSPDG